MLKVIGWKSQRKKSVRKTGKNNCRQQEIIVDVNQTLNFECAIFNVE